MPLETSSRPRPNPDVITTAQCHCGANAYTFSNASATLPYSAWACSCNISRRISGVLMTSYVPVPPHNDPPALGSLTEYRSSNKGKRYFCPICGCHMFWRNSEVYEVSTGTLGEPANLVQFKGHQWISDTRDGGGSVWINQISNSRADRWAGGFDGNRGIPELDWRSENTSNPLIRSTKDRLHAHCHCGGVEFYITRPNNESLQVSSPFPDLLVPYHSGRSVSNPSNAPWWLSEDGTRYLAGHCACRTCRLVSGFEMVQWAFVPAANIEPVVVVGGSGDGGSGDGSGDGSGIAPFRRPRLPLHTLHTLQPPQLFGMLRAYESSAGVRRCFCGRCGASVFWVGAQRGASLVDVAVGLLDAPSGARAEEWLEWVTGRVSFAEEAHNVPLTEALIAGLKEWGEGRAERKKGDT